MVASSPRRRTRRGSRARRRPTIEADTVRSLPGQGARRTVRVARAPPLRTRSGSATSWRPTPTGATAVPGLYAAGTDRPEPAGAEAAADGSRVGGHDQLQPRHEDSRPPPARRPTRRLGPPLQGRPDVERQPQRHLVNEITGLTPGRALDIGAGEGGDALAGRAGWRVTANDISQRALPARRRGRRRGLHVECHQADANAPEAFEEERSTSCRPSTHRSPHARRSRRAQRAGCGRSWRHAARRQPRPRADACTDRHAGPRPALRSRRLRTGRRLRGGARRLTGVGHRGPREAAPSPGRRLGLHHVDDIVLRARRHPT